MYHTQPFPKDIKQKRKNEKKKKTRETCIPYKRDHFVPFLK